MRERAKAGNSYQLYQTIGQTFWNAENQLQLRVDPFSAEPSPYKSPLSKSDPLYHKYFYVDQAANDYIKILDTNKEQSWTLPPALYLGGIAAFTIGDYATAQKHFSRLLQKFPDYKRPIYIGDDNTPDPDFSQPVNPGISKLLFYCQVGAHGNAPTSTSLSVTSNAFATFQ